MLTREEWQENPAAMIDSVVEAELEMHDRDELIRLMGKIIYYQAKIIKNAVNEDGSPRVSYTDFNGMEWRFGYVRDAYLDLTGDLMPQLPDDWTETLEV